MITDLLLIPVAYMVVGSITVVICAEMGYRRMRKRLAPPGVHPDDQEWHDTFDRELWDAGIGVQK